MVFVSGAGFAASMTFSGQLTCIETDTLAGRYGGVAPGTVFSGTISYGAAADAATDPNFPGDYDFSNPPYGGFITDGTTQTIATDAVQVSVDDDFTVDPASAALINCTLGTALSGGDVIDISDIDTQETFASPGGGIVFGVSFISLDSNTYTGVDFSNFAGVSGVHDRALFFISEADSTGGAVFDGLGEVTSLSFDPPLTAPYAFSVDGFNVTGNLPGSVSDDFDNGDIAPMWEIYEPTVVESGSTATFSRPGGVTPPFPVGALSLISEMSYIGSQSPGALRMQNGSGDFTGTSTWIPVLPGVNQFFTMGVVDHDSGEEVTVGIYNFDAVLAGELGVPQGLAMYFARFGDFAAGDYDIQAETIVPGDVTGNIVLKINFTDVTDAFAGAYSLNGGASFVAPYTSIPAAAGVQEFGWYMGGESMVVASRLACDLNGNGAVDSGDLSQVIRMALDIVADDLDCDIDNSGSGDGSIGAMDILAVSRIVAGIDSPVYR